MSLNNLKFFNLLTVCKNKMNNTLHDVLIHDVFIHLCRCLSNNIASYKNDEILFCQKITLFDSKLSNIKYKKNFLTICQPGAREAQITGSVFLC